MKHLLLLLVVAVLGANVTSCTGVSNTGPEPSLTQSSSTDPSKGLAIYIADPGNNIGADGGCQVDLTRLSLVGNPLSEADIEFFDQSQGLFQLKVSQYDWLGGNKDAIQAMRKGGRGYYAMAITLNGEPVMGGYAMSGFSSYACPVDKAYFLEDLTYYAPNPGPTPRSDYSYQLSIKKNAQIGTPADQTVPKIDNVLLARLKAVGKLKG